MSVAFDRAPTPEELPGAAVVDDEREIALVPDPPPARRTCRDCRASGSRIYVDEAGRCWTCAERARTESSLQRGRERDAEMAARLDASPHRCSCGAKLLDPGTCDDCGERQRREQERRALLGAWRLALPHRHRDNDFEGEALAGRVRDATAIARVLAACTATTDRITLVGPAGVGKTSVAAAAYMRLLTLRGRGEGACVHARDLALARLQHHLGSEAPIVERAIAVDVAIVDDLGVEADVARSAVADVIYSRHGRCAPTIYTTSMTAVQVAAAYGDGVMRRVYEAVAGSYVIALRPQGGT